MGMYGKVILSIMIIVFSAILHQLLTHTEYFIDPVRVISTKKPYIQPKMCEVLVNGLEEDDGQKRVMEKKLQNVRNDGKHFRYFNKKDKFFDNKSAYCYVDTFDYTKPDGAPQCDKTNALYNFSMFKSVDMGAVLEDGEAVPRQVCIAEIDKNNVFNGDVQRFSSLVNNFDNTLILEQVSDCRTALLDKNAQYNTLLDEHTQLQMAADNLLVSQEECAAQKSQYIQQSTLLSAALESSDGNVVLVDMNDAAKRITLSTDGTQNAIDVPVSFTVGYAYIPSGFALRFLKNDGTFVIFDRMTSTYPLVDKAASADLKTVYLIRKQ